MTVSLQDIALRAGVSTKTVSGALHGGSARMAVETRERIQKLADDMGYVTNLAARGTRQGWIPLVAIVADELITTPFATEILRGLDNAMQGKDMAVIATNLSAGRSIEQVHAEVRRFRPRAMAYAAMYHKVVALPPGLADGFAVMINCRDADGRVPSLVPDDEGAAYDITRHLIARGRRRIAFINLPGLLAGELREAGFRRALREAGLDDAGARVLPAVARKTYSDRAHSLVADHVPMLLDGPDSPEAILAGNDRVAMEIYAALRRAGRDIPGDVAVASFDNQVDLATRLDPPLTTMALPHREMGRLAAERLLSDELNPPAVQKLAFRLVERQSV